MMKLKYNHSAHCAYNIGYHLMLLPGGGLTAPSGSREK